MILWKHITRRIILIIIIIYTFYLIFLQILTDLSKECKDRSILLYKFFKLYFAEQEKKWILMLNKLQEKIRYYKDLFKIIIQQKNKHIDKIEDINDVLFSNKITLGIKFCCKFR